MFSSLSRQGSYSVKWDESKAKFGTNNILPLWVADMDLASPLCVQKALAQRALHPIYGYTIYPKAYFDAIIYWMRTRFAWQIEKEWIVPCYGVVPSLNFAILAYSQEGDGILLQTPLYPPFIASVRHNKRKVLDNVLIYKENSYHIDFEDFENKAKKAKLFLLCSPHNPTGRVWDKSELERIIQLCLKHQVLIISDEIHADIVYHKIQQSMGSFEAIQEYCVILNAPSKSFNIAGLNSSYAIIPNKRLRQKYTLKQDKSGISNGNPFGIDALISAYMQGSPWLDALKIHLHENMIFVQKFLQDHALPIKALPSEATFLLWLDCSQMNLEQKDLNDFFVFEAKLGLNDGESFGKAGRGFMRLNIGTDKQVLAQAMKQLHQAYLQKTTKVHD